MKPLFDFMPVLLFFVAFKLFDIYTATGAAIIASVAQVLFGRWYYGHLEKMHLISLTVITTLGSATLFFQNPLFIKWKPTGIYWLTAGAFLLSQFLSSKTIVQRMMEANLHLNRSVWSKLNLAWVCFFVLMGALNLWIAYRFDTNTWVNFKLFGGFGLTLLFVLLQSIYLTRHLSHNTEGPLQHHESLTRRR